MINRSLGLPHSGLFQYTWVLRISSYVFTETLLSLDAFAFLGKCVQCLKEIIEIN